MGNLIRIIAAIFLPPLGVFLTKSFFMVQAPGFIRGINPKSQI